MRLKLLAGLLLALLVFALLNSARPPSPGEIAQVTPSAALLAAARVQMTLAALAYVDDSGSLAEIKAALGGELAKTAYATRGDWELVWGPAAAGGNLAYIARNKRQPEQYALAIRGTDFDLLKDDVEDIWLEQVAYAYAAAGRAKLSRGSLAGLEHLQRMSDPATGQSLQDFLSAAARQGMDLSVTGHSLGGGLAALALLWLHDVSPDWGLTPEQLRLSAYTFAGPTFGNPELASHFAAAVGDRLYRFVNPLDVVPRGYGDLGAIAAEGIPTAVPLEYRAILDATTAYLRSHGLRFEQVGVEVALAGVPLPASLPYLRQVMEQHRPNSYLYLLGAPQVAVGEASLLPQHQP